MISAHLEIYSGSGIYHKPHSIFKLKPQDFHNSNTGLFIGNDTKMVRYFIGMYIYLYIRNYFNLLQSDHKLKILQKCNLH